MVGVISINVKTTMTWLTVIASRHEVKKAEG